MQPSRAPAHPVPGPCRRLDIVVVLFCFRFGFSLYFSLFLSLLSASHQLSAMPCRARFHSFDLSLTPVRSFARSLPLPILSLSRFCSLSRPFSYALAIILSHSLIRQTTRPSVRFVAINPDLIVLICQAPNGTDFGHQFVWNVEVPCERRCVTPHGHKKSGGLPVLVRGTLFSRRPAKGKSESRNSLSRIQPQ